MTGLSLKRSIFSQYLEWHFFDTPKAILAAWRNFLWFNLNYFSIPVLLRTLFSPWRRYQYSYGRGFKISRYFEALTFNLMSRGIGALLRLGFIVIGLLLEVIIFLAGLVVFLGWFFLPLILIAGFFYGFNLLF